MKIFWKRFKSPKQIKETLQRLQEEVIELEDLNPSRVLSCRPREFHDASPQIVGLAEG